MSSSFPSTLEVEGVCGCAEVQLEQCVLHVCIVKLRLWLSLYYPPIWLPLMAISLLPASMVTPYVYYPTKTPYCYLLCHVRLFPYDHPLWLTIMAIPLLPLSMDIPSLFPYYHHICLSIMAISLQSPLMLPPYGYYQGWRNTFGAGGAHLFQGTPLNFKKGTSP